MISGVMPRGVTGYAQPYSAAKYFAFPVWFLRDAGLTGHVYTDYFMGGFTGFFGYAFGSAIAGTGVGWIADHWGWGGVFATMIVCCVMAMAFVSLTLKQKGPVAVTSNA